MSDLDTLAENVEDPEFAKAYRRNKVNAIQNLIGRQLSDHEQEGIKVLSHRELKMVVKALRPRNGGPHPPE